MDPKILRLTKLDDDLYTHFRKSFPNMNVTLFTQEELKTVEAKEQWRSFCDAYKESLEDFNYGNSFDRLCTCLQVPNTRHVNYKLQPL